MRSYSPESIQFAEENKMKALLALSQIISSHGWRTRWMALFGRNFAFPSARPWKGKRNNFISFPLKHFLRKFHFIVFQSSPLPSFPRKQKMRVFVGKIIYVPRTTPVALRRYMNKDYSGRSLRQCLTFFSATNTLNPPQKTFEFSSRGKDKTANIFKVKAKDSKEFFFYLLFIFFNLCLILALNLLIYYFRLHSVSPSVSVHFKKPLFSVSIKVMCSVLVKAH